MGRVPSKPIRKPCSKPWITYSTKRRSRCLCKATSHMWGSEVKVWVPSDCLVPQLSQGSPAVGPVPNYLICTFPQQEKKNQKKPWVCTADKMGYKSSTTERWVIPVYQ